MLSASLMVALGQVCIKKPCGVEPSPPAAAEETKAFWEQRSSNKKVGGAEPGVLSCCNSVCGLSCRARKAPAACGAGARWEGHCTETRSFGVSRLGPRPCSSHSGHGDPTRGPAAVGRDPAPHRPLLCASSFSTRRRRAPGLCCPFSHWAVPVRAADWGSWWWWEQGSPGLGCGFLRGAREVPGRDFGDVAPSAWDLAAAPAKRHRQRARPGACPAAPSSCTHAHPQQTNAGSVPGWDFPPRLLSITSPGSRKEPEASSLEAALPQPPGLSSPTTSCCSLLSQGPAGTSQVSPPD